MAAVANEVTITKESKIKVVYDDILDTDPGTIAGRYLRTFWLPCFPSKDLNIGKALPIVHLGEQLTLYRGGSGDPHLVSYRCAHRGTQLSVGWIEGEDIRCMYHGWKYDKTGQCVEVPGTKDKKICKNIKIKGYPARDYLGMIFAYLGDGEPPPFPEYPEFDQYPGELRLTMHERRCNYFNNVENALDPYHVGFVHFPDPNYGEQRIVDEVDIRAEEDDWGLAYSWRGSTYDRDIDEEGYCHTHFGMPNMLRINVLPGLEGLIWKVPIDNERHWHIVLAQVPVGEELKYVEADHDYLMQTPGKVLRGEMSLLEADTENMTYQNFVNMQDDVSQIGQGIAYDRSTETLGRTDVAIMRIRRIWIRELQKLADGEPLKQWSFSSITRGSAR